MTRCVSILQQEAAQWFDIVASAPRRSMIHGITKREDARGYALVHARESAIRGKNKIMVLRASRDKLAPDRSRAISIKKGAAVRRLHICARTRNYTRPPRSMVIIPRERRRERGEIETHLSRLSNRARRHDCSSKFFFGPSFNLHGSDLTSQLSGNVIKQDKLRSAISHACFSCFFYEDIPIISLFFF